MDNSRIVPRWILLATLLAILLIAAGLRFYRLPSHPVGLHYDESANGILAGEIARGLEKPIFIAAYTGKEVLFFYWTALWMKLVGVTPFALRLSAASIGVTTVAAAVWAVYELVHNRPDKRWIALFTAAFLSVSFWHLILSRYGFRAITQPLLQALTVAALWRGLRSEDGRSRRILNRWLLLAGIFCGLTAYTYLAARAFPIPIAAALITLVLADRPGRRERLAQSGVFVGVAALILTPLAHYWLGHPGSFTTRARQVAADTWREVWNGLLACLKMLFLQGDPYIRFNLPGRPLFGPIVAGLFMVGLGVGIWQSVRLLDVSEDQDRAVSLAGRIFLLLLIPVMLLPSALATDEITPSNLRTVGLLPFIYTFPALGLWAVVGLLRRILGQRKALTRLLFPAACWLLLGLSGHDAASTYSAWSSSPALYYAADGDFVDIADHLNRTDLSATTPYVASQHYRHPTLAFLAQDYDTVHWIVGGRSLVFPPDGDGLFLFPRSAALHLDWVRSLLPEDTREDTGLGPDGSPAFYAYRVGAAQAPMPARRLKTNFGRTVQLTGYSIEDQPRSDGHVAITIWWEVSGIADQPDYRPVARLADRWGSIWGEEQSPHYPSEQWMTGELVVDRLSVPIASGTPPGDYALRLGLYAPGADARLPVLDDSGAYAGLYEELPVHVEPAARPVRAEDLGIDYRLDKVVDGLTLLGIRVDHLTVRSGEPLRVTLFWRAEEGTLPPYELSLQLGETTLYRGSPVHGTYPFDAWGPGELVADRYDPRLPIDVSPGKYQLRLHIENEPPVSLAEITVEATDRSFVLPPISHPLSVTLGHSVQLVGYDLSSDSVSPGETLTLTLTWRALTEMTTDYTVFTHLLGPDGSMSGQKDRQPISGSYPTSLWARREVVTDVYEIPVSTAAAPGEHRLEIGMYIAETGTRLSVEKSADNGITLQTVSVTK